MTNSKDAGLTADVADSHVKAWKKAIGALLPPGGRLEPESVPGARPIVNINVCSDPPDTSPHAPARYEYSYVVRDVPEKDLPHVGQVIVDHFSGSGWTLMDKTTKPALTWDLRTSGSSPSESAYLLSMIVSPKGSPLSIELDTPCVPQVAKTFEP